MICTDTGDIKFLNTVHHISTRMDKSTFLSSGLKDFITKDYSHSTASIFVLTPMKIWDREFIVMVYFDQNDILIVVELFPNENPVKLWSKLSEQHEKNVKIVNDAFLKKYLGRPPYIFTWGNIMSVYDTKGSFSKIIIRYT